MLKSLLLAALWAGLSSGLLLTAIQSFQTMPSLLEILTNVSLAVAFALLLGVASTLRGGLSSWRQGLCWGLAGYSIFFVAPSLGLSSVMPATLDANIEARQLWWLMTVFDTALGLWLLVFAKTKLNQLFGLVLLISPHAIGAPHPEVIGSVTNAEIVSNFIIVTAIANALFWMILGAVMGLLAQKNEIIKA
jgi:cobalt transporter subunit CbtA